jgi:hypothetical protein
LTATRTTQQWRSEPGSIIEQLKIIGPLTDPTAYGGKAEDAFDVVIPSLPGYGFSGKPATTGWDPIRIARAWTVLMKRLGYTRFVAQGGVTFPNVLFTFLRLSHRSRVGCHVFIGFLKHILTYINPNGDHSCALRRQNKMNSGTYSMAR